MTIETILDKCEKITLSKRQDYTNDSFRDNHENFKRSAELASWFVSDQDKSYVVLIGTKLARLSALLNNSGKKPNHESIEDTFVDLINYCALWAERRLDDERFQGTQCSFNFSSHYTIGTDLKSLLDPTD